MFLVQWMNKTSTAYHVLTKSTNSSENSIPSKEAANRGGSPCTTWNSCSKTLPHFGYGKRPVATSISVIPKDQTSLRTSYPLARWGSIRSGWNVYVRAQQQYYIWQDDEFARLPLTAIYGRHPASLVRAIESTSCPDIPKSQSFISPHLCNKMLLGLTSRWMIFNFCFK